mgnify:CR=1 FL=1
MIEKQNNVVYPGVEGEEVEDINIYSTNEGKVEYALLGAKKDAYYQIKTYRDIPVDTLSAVTSAMSKLAEGEAIAIQIVVSPTDEQWAKQGKKFISETKKSEANPEKESYKVDARQLEAIENKCSKHGFETAIRIVSVAPDKGSAKGNLSNIKGTFSQFESPWNSIGGRKIRFKGIKLVKKGLN